MNILPSMNIDKFFDELNSIEIEALRLHEKGRILRSTLDLIRFQTREIREELNYVKEDMNYEQDIVESFGGIVSIFKKLIDGAATDTKENEIRILTQEFLEIISEGCSIDLFLVESNDSDSPLCSFNNREKNELTFLLIFPTADYLNKDRIGLVAHETAHVHKNVKRFADSVLPQRKKIGESLADIFGLSMTGPLFAHSLSFFVINDIGSENASKILKNHLSFIARAEVLKHVNSGLWEGSLIRGVVLEKLERVLQGRRPNLQEDSMISKCVNEYYRDEREFKKFRIDENRITNFKNEDEDSMLYVLTAEFV